MSVYKLYYFNSRGRAEPCRLAFAAANIEYEDKRLDSEEWQKEKKSGRPPFGTMPFIETPEGYLLGGGWPITKYICKLAGLSPVDLLEEATADMIVDGVDGVMGSLVEWFKEQDQANKEKLKKTLHEVTLPAYLEKFEVILKRKNEGQGFFFGEKLTYADIFFFYLCNIFAEEQQEVVPFQLKHFKLLVNLYNRVRNLPQIKAWIEKRPKTQY